MAHEKYLILAICALIWASGCGPSDSALFEVDGVQKHQECLGKTFPFRPIFHAYRERADSVGIFFQSRGGNAQFVDVVHFEVFDPTNVETGTPITLDPIITYETRVASTVELGESCPEVNDSIGLLGTITFDSFSQEIGTLISGTVDGELTSLRDLETVASSFTGEFEFTSQVGQPFEEFRN